MTHMRSLSPSPTSSVAGRRVPEDRKPKERKAASVNVNAIAIDPDTTPNAEALNRIMTYLGSILRMLSSYSLKRVDATLEPVRTKLAGFSPSTLEIIDSTIRWRKTDPGIGLTTSHLYQFITKPNDENHIRELMTFYPHVENSIFLTPGRVEKIIKGLHDLDHFKDSLNLDELVGRDADTAIAFIKVTSHLCKYTAYECTTVTNDDRSMIHVASKELHDLIVDHPDKSEEMMQFIKERHTGDAELIREYIGQDSALKQGWL